MSSVPIVIRAAARSVNVSAGGIERRRQGQDRRAVRVRVGELDQLSDANNGVPGANPSTRMAAIRTWPALDRDRPPSVTLTEFYVRRNDPAGDARVGSTPRASRRRPCRDSAGSRRQIPGRRSRRRQVGILRIGLRLVLELQIHPPVAVGIERRVVCHRVQVVRHFKTSGIVAVCQPCGGQCQLNSVVATCPSRRPGRRRR